MLQCVAVCCSLLQSVVVCCSLLQFGVAVYCTVLHCVALCCTVLKYVHTHTTQLFGNMNIQLSQCVVMGTGVCCSACCNVLHLFGKKSIQLVKRCLSILVKKFKSQAPNTLNIQNGYRADFEKFGRISWSNADWASWHIFSKVRQKHTATYYNVLQHTATHYSTPQYAATPCNTR